MNTPNDDISLVREPRRPAGRQPRMMMTDELREPDVATPQPRQSRRPRTSTPKNVDLKPDNAKSEARRRVILGVLLGAMGLLMLLALISYSRADQANTDIRPNDLIGLFTNDDAVRAKFDVTQNWVGLLGAIIANFLINGTVGFAALVIPALSVLWGIALVRNSAGRKLALITSYVLLGAMIFASFIGTLQRIAWMPPIPMELSGNIGQFVSSIFSHLIGTAGALLLFAVAGFIVAVVAFDADIHRTLMRVKLFVD